MQKMHLWLRGVKNVLPDVLLLWCCHNKNTLWKKAAFDPIKWFFEKEVQNYVREFLAENIQKTTLTKSNLHDKGQKESSMNHSFN